MCFYKTNVNNISVKTKKDFKKIIFKKSMLPACAVTLFLGTVFYWNNQNYGLALECNGQQIATVSNEKVYEEATHRLFTQTHYTDEKIRIKNNDAKFKLTTVNCKECCEQPEVLKEKIIEKSNDSLIAAYELYINNKSVGIAQSKEEINEILESLLEQGKLGFDSADVNFEEIIEIKDGIFSSEKVQSKETLKELLEHGAEKSDLYTIGAEETLWDVAEKFGTTVEKILEINGKTSPDEISCGDSINIKTKEKLLHIKLTKTEIQEVEVPYSTERSEDADKYVGYEEVTQEGINGKEAVTYKVEYTDGKETFREELDRSVISIPVNRKIIVGTKVKEYIWPVPSAKKITSPFGARTGGYHFGVDLASAGVEGTDILAAKSGTVEKAVNSGAGYGNHIIINHGDGTKTLYGHCKSLCVSEKSTVAQGQKIALVGNTGDSHGAHLHFEIRINGTQIDPTQHIK